MERNASWVSSDPSHSVCYVITRDRVSCGRAGRGKCEIITLGKGVRYYKPGAYM